MKNNSYDGLIYACGTGRQKKWARETLIMDLLYNTTEDMARFLKFKDMGKLDECDEETDKYLIYKFGYINRHPKTEIDLYVCKSNGLLFLKKDDIGWGFDEVEKEVYKFIEEQINNKNLYLETNLNCEEFLIK